MRRAARDKVALRTAPTRSRGTLAKRRHGDGHHGGRAHRATNASRPRPARTRVAVVTSGLAYGQRVSAAMTCAAGSPPPRHASARTSGRPRRQSTASSPPRPPRPGRTEELATTPSRRSSSARARDDLSPCAESGARASCRHRWRRAELQGPRQRQVSSAERNATASRWTRRSSGPQRARRAPADLEARSKERKIAQRQPRHARDLEVQRAARGFTDRAARPRDRGRRQGRRQGRLLARCRRRSGRSRPSGAPHRARTDYQRAHLRLDARRRRPPGDRRRRRPGDDHQRLREPGGHRPAARVRSPRR